MLKYPLCNHRAICLQDFHRLPFGSGIDRNHAYIFTKTQQQKKQNPSMLRHNLRLDKLIKISTTNPLSY